MKKVQVVVLVLLAVLALTVGVVSADVPRNYQAHLNGAGDNVDTLAQGQAVFQVAKDGSAVYYRLMVANLDNTLMGHIHLAPEGVNGPIVVWLYPKAPPPQLIPGSFSGVLMEGSFTAANLVGPLSGMTLEDLVAAIEAGNAYVNVHTSAHPGGEIRGQIQ